MIKTLRGYMFYGKPLRLNFAKKESDFIAKLRGNFDEQVFKRRSAVHQEDNKARELKAKRKIINKLLKLRQQTGAQLVHGQTIQAGEEFNQPAGYMYENLQPMASVYHGHGEPEKYKILFLEKVPKSVRADQLDDIFGRYLGFVEVRLIAEKGVAFIEFYSDDYAAFALNDLRGPNASLLGFKDESGATFQTVITFGKN